MRCASPGVSGESSLTSRHGSRTSGGGNGKAGSCALRGGKESSEAELTRVEGEESAAETGVARGIWDTARAKAGERERRAGE